MASQAQSVDELIMTLVSMGFSVDDGQEAIKAGKLTVEEAVEWLLQGKPAPVVATAPRLSLRPQGDGVVGANPFTNPPAPQPVPAAPVPTTSQGAAPSQEALPQEATEEQRLKSRLHLNDEQRVYKERFEEKKREEAKKRARSDKAEQKMALESIRKQIAEDREVQRLRKQGIAAKEVAASGGSPEKMDTTPAPSSDSQSKPKSPSGQGDRCLLQIRLPSGQVLRQNFAAGDPLSTVWSFVQEKCPTMENMCLMQPFPRQEFGAQNMTSSLQELKLTPSGSLVLKKMEAPPAQPNVAVAEEESIADEEEGVEEDEGPPDPPSHSWGTGQALGDTPGQEGQQGQGQPLEPLVAPPPGDDNNSDDEEEEMDLPPPQQGGMPQGFGGMPGGMPQGFGGMPPGFGGMPGFGGPMGMGQQQQQEADHIWGEGQALSGYVGYVLPPIHASPSHDQQSASQEAAKAAAQRFASNSAAAAAAASASTSSGSSTSGSSFPSTTTQAIPSLTQLAIRLLTSRLCDARVPLLSLGGVPADVAGKIFEHLVKEKLLRPRTLQPFVPCRLRKMVLDCYSYTTNELLQAIRHHTYVIHLSLSSCTLITDRGLQPVTALKRLKFLNLGSCRQLTNNCLPIISEFSELITLNLEETGVTDVGIQSYASTVPQQLQHLNLNRTAVTHAIFQSLQALPKLRSLGLEQTKICSLTGVQNLTGLESLDIASTNIVTESLVCIASHPSLAALSIAQTNNVDGDQALQYISGLKLHSLQLPSRHTTTNLGLKFIQGMLLTSLDLTNYINVGDEAMSCVGQMKSLRRLLLSNTKVTDEGVLLLDGLIHLEVLYLDRTGVTDKGVLVVQFFTKILELSLSGTGVTSDFLSSGVLTNCQLLTKLNLSRTHISGKELGFLQLPCLTLLNIDHTRVRADVAMAALDQGGCPRLMKISMSNLQPVTMDH